MQGDLKGFFLVGRFLLKLNWVLLARAICCAMTSIPGLGVAIGATWSEEGGAGKGARYLFRFFLLKFYQTIDPFLILIDIHATKWQ